MIKISIHGVPRSGTTWLGSIFDSSPYVSYRHQPLFSYAFKDYLDENSSYNKINEFFKQIYLSNDEFICQVKEKKEQKIPIFKKEVITHIVYKEARYHNVIENILKKNKDVKIVGIVRNPKSVIASWYLAPKEFDKPSWDLKQEWLLAQKKNQNKKENFYGYEKWKIVTKQFLNFEKRYPNNFYLVKYSKLLNNTITEVKKVFDFVDLKITPQTIDFINNKTLDSKDPYSVYRSKQMDNKWKDILPNEIIDYIDNDLRNTDLYKFVEYEF